MRFKIFVSLLLLLMTKLSAATYLFDLDTKYSGNGTPGGLSPWIQVALSDKSPNVVQLQMSTTNLAGSEYVKEWYFNFSGDSSVLSFQRISGAPPGDIKVKTGSNTFAQAGGGGFDIEFKFPDKKTDQFTGGNSITYDITSTGSLSAAMFNVKSGAGTYYSSSRVQGIGNNNHAWIASATSNEVNTPEPATYLILLTFLSLAYFLKQKQAKTT